MTRHRGGSGTSGPIPPRFAVIGTGRSGTGYVSAVLRASGVDCGHEQWWTPLPRRVVSGLDGDSSWMALPDIEGGAWSGPVVHVTRHPVDVVASLLGIEFFTVDSPYRDFVYTHEPALPETPLEAAVEWWARWNTRCAQVADLTVPAEGLRLHDIADVIGHRVVCSWTVPETINHRNRAAVDGAEIWQLLHGERFGYSCD